ncbi:MAG: hypothetical protein ABIQ40_12955 [Bacteroidia bacterium]
MEPTTSSSKFFDTIDNIDRYLYGRKMKNFLIGSICVLIIAPILDWALEVPYDRLTWLSTFVFMIYVFIIVLAWISGWRDDAGKWTLKRAVSRLSTYYQTFRDNAAKTKTTSKDEMLYNTGWWLFFGAIGWKSLQNLSVFVRKPIQNVTGHTMTRFIRFEKFTIHWYWLPLILGIGVMIYLFRSNPKIIERIKKDLLQLFGRRRQLENNRAEVFKIETGKTDNLVLNSKRDEHMLAVVANNKSILFNGFVNAMQSWHPVKCHYEYEFQDQLYRHLKNVLPASVIELEYPIGDKALGNKGRADIVIDDSILIEMKRGDTSASAVQRAKGQISQYSEIWRNRGPVILLLCGHDYEHAKVTFTSTMIDLVKLERPVLTFVQEN